MSSAAIDWDIVIGSLYRSNGSLATRFDSFRTALMENLKYKAARCYLIHESGAYFRPLEFRDDQRVIGWSELKHPKDKPIYWDIDLENPSHNFPEHESCNRYVAVQTASPSGERNGLILLGYHSKQNMPKENIISSSSANLLRYQFGALIHDHQQQTKQQELADFQANSISASLDATLDSYIIYDGQGRVVAFSPNHVLLYPWLEGHLKIGAHFSDLIRVVAYGGFLPDLEGREEEWIQKRLSMRRGTLDQVDTILHNGRTVRTKEHALPDGGWIASLSDITAFKATEDRLRKRERTYRNLLEASPDAITIMQGGRTVFVNKQVQELFRAESEEQLLSVPYLNYVYPADIKAISSQISQIGEQEKLRLTCRMLRLDGSMFYADITYGPVEWNDKAAALFTVRDVSESHQMMETLETQKAQLQHAQKLFNAGHWEYDFRDAVFRPSENLAPVLGISPDKTELTYDEMKGLFPPGEFKRLERHLIDGIEGKGPFDLEHRGVINGQEIYIQGRAQGVYDDEGNIICVFGISRDVTERKKLEDALRLNEKRFKDLALFVSDVYWETDKDGYFTYISSDIEKLLGRKSDWYIKRSFEDIFSEQEQEMPVIKKLIYSLRTHEAYRNLEFPRTNPVTGVKCWFNGSAIPIYDRHGKFDGFRGYNTDITQRIKLEDKIKRTQKLEAIGGLSGGVAHDFNNLLGIILGNAEMLNEELGEDASEASHTKLDNIIAASNRGAELTHRMLAYAQNQPLAPACVRINEQVDNMLSIARRTLGADIDITAIHSPDLKETRVDPNQVENAVLNLFLNARDAMPNGGEIIVRTENCHITAGEGEKYQLAPGAYICLTVEDTGTGIPEDIQEAIFDPFFTTKPIGKGSGLGLSMIMGFAKQSGGTVRVKSAPGEGTAISVYLPAIEC